MFHRLGAAALKPNLDNILDLSQSLGNPHQAYKSIHIAGTNGKGSTSHMLASILQKNGYKTGLYTSPHLKDFRERIRIDGKKISKKNVIDFIKNHREVLERIKPSFFEMTLALAFDHFSQNGVEIAVIETGLGGRLDSTNIIKPELSIITNISRDHMDILGDSLDKIAFEKAGIIKDGIPVIIGERNLITDPVFIEKALSLNAPITFAEDEWEIVDSQIKSGYQDIWILPMTSSVPFKVHLDLLGHYQLKNIKSILSALKILPLNGIPLDFQKSIQSLSQVKKRTGLRGRWEILSQSPLTICDTGHNEDGIKELVDQLNLTPYKNLHFVFGVVKDKELDAVLSLLPQNAYYYFCKADIPRAMEAEILMNQASAYGLKGKSYASVIDALDQARILAQKDDLIFIGGSTFVVAEIIP